MKSVIYLTCTKLPCIATSQAPVILCLADSVEFVSGKHLIEAILVVSQQISDDCSCESYWSYTFSYDETLLTTPSAVLTSADIVGVFCKTCFTDWVEGFAVSSFQTINTPLGNAPVADEPNSTLNFTVDINLKITGDETTDTVEFGMNVSTNNQWLITENAAGDNIIRLIKGNAADDTVVNAEPGQAIILAENDVAKWRLQPTSGNLEADVTDGGSVVVIRLNEGTRLGVILIAADIAAIQGGNLRSLIQDDISLGDLEASVAVGDNALGYHHNVFKTRATDGSANAAVEAGILPDSSDELYALTIYGADGVNYQPAAAFRAVIPDVFPGPGPTNMPGNWEVWTTEEGTVILSRRWIYNSIGDFENDPVSGRNVKFNKAGTGVQDTVHSGITATGTVFGDAFQLLNTISVVDPSALNAGVKLPNFAIGQSGSISNLGATDILIYGFNVGDGINGAVGPAKVLPGRSTMKYSKFATNSWVMWVSPFP